MNANRKSMLEKDIIQACIDGDKRMYREVYNLCAPYVFSIIKNYFEKEEDRKDAMQEVFASLYLSLKNFNENKGTFKSWLSQIVVHQCISLIRKSKMIIVSYPIEDNLESMDGYMEKLELLTNADLEQMLNAMPQGYKTIFLMYVIEEYSHKEIGELLGISAETSRSQLFRAIKWIKNNILTDAKLMQYGISK
ncbi:MAG: sigma-70 family RNA polymerase sigma factor [Lewinellaceae bacterium]|nr:sigma-70 family RNA polymerase sigma factor [Lewinellaceae bacterium]